MAAFFITGTDTGIGKTFFTDWLVRSWRARGHAAAALKPISAGDRGDAVLLRAASGDLLSLDETNPVFLRQPAAPLVAAQDENRTLDFAALNTFIALRRGQFTHLAVEGVGGWRVPLAPGYDVRDWARELDLPVVVVAPDRLGMLNHTLLTVDSIRDAGLVCAGLVVNAGPGSVDLPDLDAARLQHVVLLRRILSLPILELGRGVHAPGHVPVWLGGEEV